jgi:hypothetical protein
MSRDGNIEHRGDPSGKEATDATVGRLADFRPSLLSAADAKLHVPMLAPLITLWEERLNGERAPCWSQMYFEDFRGWHADLVLSSFEGEEPDPLFRLVGETFNEMTGRTVKGMRFSALYPDLYANGMRDHFTALRATARIGVGEGQVDIPGREHISLRVLELPFRNGGPRIDRLVHVVQNRGK